MRDRSAPITLAHVVAAKEALILERRTHLDSLLARLREPRVRRVLDPVLAGGKLPFDDIDDDVLFDLRSTAPWTERLYQRDRQVGGRLVHVVGC